MAADAKRTRCVQIYIEIGHKPARNHTSHPKVKTKKNPQNQTTQNSHPTEKMKSFTTRLQVRVYSYA